MACGKPLEFDDTSFNQYAEFIHDLTGITIEKNRKAMLVGRIRRRVTELNLATYQDYLSYLSSHIDEKNAFINMVTTNKTYFYRTPRVWSYVAETFLPEWFKKNPTRTFWAWSAAASSGEEAHTLGVLCQQFKDKNPGFEYSILGTDISSEVIEKCEIGIYQEKSIERFRKEKPILFQKYVSTNAGNYSVKNEIKSRISFRTHNLFEPLRGRSFSLVLLRNVLIYFTVPDQEKVITNIQNNLKDNAVLVIGESESISRIQTNLEYVEPLIYQTTNVD